MRWVTSTRLNQWADTRDSQGLLPELMFRLIRATSSHIIDIRFPYGDAIHLSGWDGILEIGEKLHNIPEGKSLWECGTNKGIKRKAEEDYKKRTDSTSVDKRLSSTFVFVTPRIWDKSFEWSKSKQQIGEWKSVVVITAIELEDWLSLCPAVSLWFFETILGESLNGVQDLESYWNKWAYGEGIVLEPNLLLGGREKEQQDLLDNLSEPSVTIIQSMAQSESLAFAVAAILKSPNASSLLPKCIVIEDENLIEKLANEFNNLIFLANLVNKNHTYVLRNSHCIVYSSSPAETFVPSAKLISLPLLDRDKFVNSLVDSGLKKRFAEQLSRETARNITILRRRLGLDFSCPEWAKPDNIRDLIPAILISRWSNSIAGDQEIISLFSGEPYHTYIKKLQKWVNMDDSPIINIDGKWRVYSPFETFQYAARFITLTDFDRFKEALNLISKDNDPDALLKMNSDVFHWWSFKQKYSSRIKEGLFQTAIMISLLGGKEQISFPTNLIFGVDNIINEILNQSTIEWWLSNQSILYLLAESSPRSYIRFIQEDLKKPESIIKQLFAKESKKTFWAPQDNYSRFLFSIQTLLWDEVYLLPVSFIILDCYSIAADSETKERLINALYETYAIWAPQTFADTNTRLTTLRTLSTKYPSVVFNLLYKLLNKLDSSVVMCTHPMRWRSFNYSKPVLSHKDVNESVNTICQLLISICSKSVEQICKVLDLANQVGLGERNRYLLFQYVETNKHLFLGNYEITNTIRQTIYNHKTYSDTKWALSSEEIHKWSILLAEMESNNLLEKYRWIFKSVYIEVEGIDRRNLSYEEKNKLKCEFKAKIIQEIERAYGFDGVCRFAKMVDCPDIVGASYANSSNESLFIKILDLLLINNENPIIKFTKGFFRRYVYQNGVDAIISIINAVDFDKYRSIIVIPLLEESCFCHTVWSFIDSLPISIKDDYWNNASAKCCFHYDEAEFLITRFIEYKRYNDSIYIISQALHHTNIPTCQIEESINGLLFANQINSIHHHYLAEVIYYLDNCKDVNIHFLYLIELIFFELLGQNGHNDETKLVKEILSNPYSMMEIIDKAYLSYDKGIDESGPVSESDVNYSQFCCRLLSGIHRIPFVDNDLSINVVELNNYIDSLINLGVSHNKSSQANTIIGELLANYPEDDNYPPIPICDILEKYNNVYINRGFQIKIMNKRGVIVRSPFDGGMLEIEESKKYKKYADKVRFTHPIVSNIFDEISNDYDNMSKREDVETQIIKMEY